LPTLWRNGNLVNGLIDFFPKLKGHNLVSFKVQ